MRNEGKRSNGKYSTRVQPLKHLTFHPSLTCDLDSLKEEESHREFQEEFGYERNFRQNGSRTANDWISEGLRSSPSVSLFNPPDGRTGSLMLFNMLPKVEFKPFTGNPNDWPEFISMFKDMVPDVMPTNSQRMIVLRLLLSAEVKAYIADYLTSPNSYFAALQQLRRRHGQPQLVARAHLQTLRYLQRVRDEDPAGLLNLSRAVFGAIHALSGSGYEQDLKSGMTLEIVVDKLPQRVKSSWGMKVYKMAPKRATLKDLAVWLDAHAIGETMFHNDRPDQKNVRPRPNGNHPAILAM